MTCRPQSPALPDLVCTFATTRQALLSATDAVPQTARRTPFVGHWHLMDLLAHLIGWDYANVEAIKALQNSRTPDFYAHYDPNWASYNQQLIERHGSDNWQALRNAIEHSQAEIVAALKALPQDGLSISHTLPERERPTTIAGILRAAIRDEQEHLQQIDAFTRALAD